MNTTATSDAADWIGRLVIEGLFDFAKPTDYVDLADVAFKGQWWCSLDPLLGQSFMQCSVPLECSSFTYKNEDYKYMLEVTLNLESQSDLMISFRPGSQRYPVAFKGQWWCSLDPLLGQSFMQCSVPLECSSFTFLRHSRPLLFS
jgi:hypothetical protein